MIRTLLLAAALGLGLGACDVLNSDVGLFGDSDDTAPASTACTAQSCPQANSFCVARGYTAGTAAYDRCMVSVLENLRKDSR
jgi:hypothetical protein